MGVGVVHPDNELNGLSGDEWLYFTKSLWTTAYPSELGHALRKAHGANKPPRLMARLIEFFTKPGELVLDPFAGVGGTLLGAAICRRRGGRSASRSNSAGPTSTPTSFVRRWANATAWARCWPISAQPTRAARALSTPPVRAWWSATRPCCCATWPTDRSTSSPPTRPTTPSSS